MDLKKLLKFIRLIETVPIDYMITDSIAAILYGRPRLTQDMDIVVTIPADKLDLFACLFDIAEYYCPPLETIRDKVKRGNKGHFNIIDQSTGFKIDVYPAGKGQLESWGLANRKELELIACENAFVAPPEYVIVSKLVYFKEGGSEKHLEDIRGMLQVSDDAIERSKIHKWATKMGVAKEWARI